MCCIGVKEGIEFVSYISNWYGTPLPGEITGEAEEELMEIGREVQVHSLSRGIGIEVRGWLLFVLRFVYFYNLFSFSLYFYSPLVLRLKLLPPIRRRPSGMKLLIHTD